LTFARWSPGADVPAEYARQTKDWGIGYATTLKDHPAWVIADHPAIQLRGVAAIHATIGDVEVTLFGRMDIDQSSSRSQSRTSACRSSTEFE